jgi:hypothetical protein
LAAYPATTDALAAALGEPLVWSAQVGRSPPGDLAGRPVPEPDPVRNLLGAFPSTAEAMAGLLGEPAEKQKKKKSGTGLTIEFGAS